MLPTSGRNKEEAFAAENAAWKKLNVTAAPRMVQITGEKQKEPVALEVWGQEYDFQEEFIGGMSHDHWKDTPG